MTRSSKVKRVSDVALGQGAEDEPKVVDDNRNKPIDKSKLKVREAWLNSKDLPQTSGTFYLDRGDGTHPVAILDTKHIVDFGLAGFIASRSGDIDDYLNSVDGGKDE